MERKKSDRRKDKDPVKEDSVKDYFYKKCVDTVLLFFFWVLLSLFVFKVGIPSLYHSLAGYISAAPVVEKTALSLFGLF